MSKARIQNTYGEKEMTSGTNTTERPYSKAERLSNRWPVLAAGDLVCFLLFAALGRASHEESVLGPFFLGPLQTAAPFLATWAVAAPLAGAYNAHHTARPRGAILRALLAWAVADPLGVLLRSLILQRPVQLSFIVVAFLSNAAILSVWRGLYARFLAPQSPD